MLENRIANTHKPDSFQSSAAAPRSGQLKLIKNRGNGAQETSQKAPLAPSELDIESRQSTFFASTVALPFAFPAPPMAPPPSEFLRVLKHPHTQQSMTGTTTITATAIAKKIKIRVVSFARGELSSVACRVRFGSGVAADTVRMACSAANTAGAAESHIAAGSRNGGREHR